MQPLIENYGFTVMLSPDGSTSDGIAVVDLNPDSKTYGEIVHQVIVPNKGDEFHHFGWNAFSSSLSPLSGHAFLERRYLIVPGIRYDFWWNLPQDYMVSSEWGLPPQFENGVVAEDLFLAGPEIPFQNLV